MAVITKTSYFVDANGNYYISSDGKTYTIISSSYEVPAEQFSSYIYIDGDYKKCSSFLYINGKYQKIKPYIYGVEALVNAIAGKALVGKAIVG